MTRRAGNRYAVASEDDIVRSTLDDHTVAVLREAAAVRGLPVDQLIAALLRAPGLCGVAVRALQRWPAVAGPVVRQLNRPLSVTLRGI